MSRVSRFLDTIIPSRRGTPPVDSRPLSVLPREKLKALEKSLGIRIRQKDVFVQALQHRSYHQRSHHPARSNERLEFLGDSILNLIVGEHLYTHYPKAQEGELTKLRSRLVNKNALAAYAREIGLSEFILMSPSAAQAGRKGRETIAADTFEAVIAAIYLDRGFNAAAEFVRRQVLGALQRGLVVTQDQNFKSKLLEFSQSRGLGVPRYVLLSQEGPDHDRTFTVEVLIGGTRYGSGSGKNKKEAEQAAAQQTFQEMTSHGHP